MTRRTRERRKVLWAVLASVLIHLAVAFSLAAFSKAEPPLVADEEKPSELTLMDIAPPPDVPKNPAFVQTDPAKASAEKPKEQTFESNENSIGASSATASGDAPMPSQDGKDRPFMSMESQPLSLPADGGRTQAQKQPAPEAQPTPSAAPQPTATPEPEQFAMLTSTPTPPANVAPSATPEVASTPPQPEPQPTTERAASDFRAQKEQTRISGRLTNRGPAAVNAVGTPLGKYQKQVSDAIGARWYYFMKNKIDLVSVGTAHVEAELDASGHVQHLRVLSNNANEAFANICLQSFQEAKLPPIPPDLVSALPDGKMSVDIYFTTYAN